MIAMKWDGARGSGKGVGWGVGLLGKERRDGLLANYL